jgi:hypothetical protein
MNNPDLNHGTDFEPDFPWYVAEFNACAIIRAGSIHEALQKAIHHPLLAGKRLRVIRPATPDDLDLHERLNQEHDNQGQSP